MCEMQPAKYIQVTIKHDATRSHLSYFVLLLSFISNPTPNQKRW